MTQSKIGLRKEILICYLSVGPNMSTVISIPYAKDPDSDPGAILFSEELESTMELRGVSNYIVKNSKNSHKIFLSGWLGVSPPPQSGQPDRFFTVFFLTASLIIAGNKFLGYCPLYFTL